MHDVIVVGARCAGSAIAMLLARRGHSVLLLDRDTFPSDLPMSTHFVHQRGIACLARWGLRDAVVATQSTPVTRWEIDLGAFTLSGSPPLVEGESEAFAPRRILLDEILVRAAQRSGAELREGCEVTGLVSEGDRVSGVRASTAAGSAFEEKARLVIGADGPSSRVAAAAGASQYAEKPALQATAWVYWDGAPADRFELHLREYEAIYAFPTSNGATVVGANFAIDRFRDARRDLEGAYFGLLRRAAPELAARIACAKRADDRLYVGSTRSFFRKACGPGWALLGDAHYKKDPCTAQGITDAFCDAELLAEAIDEALHDDRDPFEAIERYEKRCVEWVMPFYEFTSQMATFAPPPPEMLVIYGALRGNQADTDAFCGLVSEAVSPTEFFAPQNVERILKHAAA